MKVLYKEPGMMPVEKEIENELNDLQYAVGGYIEVYQIREDVLIICDEEGKLKNKPYNCTVRGEHFAGSIMCVGNGGEDFTDCPISADEFSEMIEGKRSY